MAASPQLLVPDGDLAIDFVERFCVQSKGAEGGKLIRLRGWQKTIVRELLSVDTQTGLRLHRTALIGMAKKNGKSLLSSTLAAFFLNVDTEPGGEIYSAAASKDQAKIVFNETKKMIESSPALLDRCTPYRDAIECVNGTVYRAISADARTQDGINPSVCVFDEVHRQPSSELWSIVQMGMAARRQPLLIGITTAGDGPLGICWDLYDYGRRVKSGEIDDPTFYFRWFEPENPKVSHLDRDAWAEANPGLGDFLSWEAVEAESKQLPEGDFRRLRLNQWPSGVGNWLPQGSWAPLASDRKVVPGETKIVLSFDGSYSDDATAIVGATIEEKPHVMVLGLWEKPVMQPTWRVPLHEVKQTLMSLIDEWNPVELVVDPSFWKDILLEVERERPRVLIVETPPRNARTAPATQLFFQLVTSGRISHDGNPALARHVGNAQLVQTAQGGVIRKETKGSSKKIDLAVAAVMAVDRAVALSRKGSRVRIWNLADL